MPLNYHPGHASRNPLVITGFWAQRGYSSDVKRFLWAALSLALAAGLSGCAPAANSAEQTPSATASDIWPTIDPSLIPPAATPDLPTVNPADYATFTDYIFKIGTGPTWCSINEQNAIVTCEQDEAATQYDPIPMPSTCDYSFGFQIRLHATVPTKGKVAEFTCSGGYYADPSKAKVLDDGYSIKVAGFTCYTAGQTARCDNSLGNYIVLGAKAWALGN